MHLKPILLMIVFAFTQMSYAKSSLETFHDLQKAVDKEFSAEPSLRMAMEYMIFADIIRMQYAKGVQRPTFMIDTTKDQIHDLAAIMKRVSSVTQIPHAIVDIHDLINKKKEEAINTLKERLFAVLPHSSKRFHIAITIPTEPLVYGEKSFFEEIEKILTNNSFTYKGASFPLENVDFVFHIGIPGLEDNFKFNEPLKVILYKKNKLPFTFVSRMRQVFPLLESGCRADFEI